LIHEATFQLNKKIEKKELQLIVETSPVTIIVDRDKLKQVLLNILDNSVKFSNKGEEIRIIQTTFQNELRIEIKDNGIGITKENQKHIMESFYKIDSKSLGAGLGLAISKNIIELHHGSIQIESEYEKGTSIIILLPIEDK
jgi:signal transduction histidine kinase